MNQEYTKTITDKIHNHFGDEFHILLTVPFTPPVPGGKNRVPITVHIGENGPQDKFGCYIYSIPDPRSNKIFSTILNNANEQLLDITKRVSTTISKKYATPAYVSVSGQISYDDFVPIAKGVIELIMSNFNNL